MGRAAGPLLWCCSTPPPLRSTPHRALFPTTLYFLSPGLSLDFRPVIPRTPTHTHESTAWRGEDRRPELNTTPSQASRRRSRARCLRASVRHSSACQSSACHSSACQSSACQSSACQYSSVLCDARNLIGRDRGGEAPARFRGGVVDSYPPRTVKSLGDESTSPERRSVPCRLRGRSIDIELAASSISPTYHRSRHRQRAPQRVRP